MASDAGSGASKGGADGGPRDAAPVSFSFDGGFPAGTPLKGVAFAESGGVCADLTTLKLSWFYNWGGSTGCKSAPPFVPMVWGNWNTLTSVSSPQKIAAAGFNIVLGFNEPDNAGQSNMTVAQAIALWPQMLQPNFQRVGGPATSSAPTGMTWGVVRNALHRRFRQRNAHRSFRQSDPPWARLRSGTCGALRCPVHIIARSPWAELRSSTRHGSDEVGYARA